MKYIGKFLVALALLFVSATAHSERFFRDFSGKDGITTTYVGSEMLGKVNLNNMLSGLGVTESMPTLNSMLESIEILNVEKAKKVKSYKSSCEKIVNQLEDAGRASLITETTKNNELVRIYSLRNQYTDKTDGILVYVYKPKQELTLVVVKYSTSESED